MDDEKLELMLVVPTLQRGGIHPRTFQSLWALDLPPKDRMVSLFPTDRPTTSARSDAVKMAKELEVDALLFIDSDMEFQSDLYRRLLAVEADIACGMFWTKRIPSYPTICVKAKAEDGTDLLRTIVPDGKIQSVDACGMAATLIRKKVLDWSDYPSFQHLGAISEDFVFCLKARDAGFSVKCDTSLKVAHRGDIAFNGQPILSYAGMAELSFPFGEVGDGSSLTAV